MNDRPDPLADLLADHDAGLPVDPSVLTDPRASGVLDALAATRAELAAVQRDPVPPEFAGRWDAALAEAARTDTSQTGPDPAAAPLRSPSDVRSGSAGSVAGPRVGGPAGTEDAGPAGPLGADGRDPLTGRVAPARPAGRPGAGNAGPVGADWEDPVVGPVAPPRPAGRPGAGTAGPVQADGRDPVIGPAALPRPAGRPGAGTADPVEADGRSPAVAPVGPGPPARPAGRPGDTPRRDRGSRSGVPNRPPGPAGPQRRGRSRRPRPAVLAGLVLVVVLVVAGVVGVRRDQPPSVSAAQLGGIARASLGVQEAGPLADPVRREACLRAVAPPGLAPDAPLAGGRSVTFEGRPGILLLLITGRLATFRVVVVTPGCEALLADTLVGP